MKKSFFLTLIVGAFLATTIFSCRSKQPTPQKVSDAIEDTASSKDAYFRAITKIAYAKYLKGETKSSLEYAYIALGRSIEERSEHYEATLSFLIGINKANIGDYNGAMPYFRRTINIYNGMSTPKDPWNGLYQKVYTLLNTMQVMQNAGKYDDAIRMLPDLNRSLRLLAETPDTLGLKESGNHSYGFMPRSAFKLAKSSETMIFEMQQRQQEAELRTLRIALIMGGVIFVLLCFIEFRIVRYNRIITRKNASAVDTINRLLQYREALKNERLQNELLKEAVAEEKEKQTKTAAEAPVEVAKTDVESVKTTTDEAKEDADRALFSKLSEVIMRKKMFLQPKLSREDVINEVYVPHNKFAQLFTRFSGMSFTKYINELRLEYAAELLRDRPDYTIEAIGEECGMPIAQTFYRNFSDKFGVTPADFRHLSHKNAQKQQIMNNRDKE